jgi:hypothetical protein
MFAIFILFTMFSKTGGKDNYILIIFASYLKKGSCNGNIQTKSFR